MKAFLALAALAMFAAIAQAADAPPPDAWRKVDPNNLLLIDTAYGQVAVELAPQFAPEHVARVRALTKAHFYDGKSFYRVIDGFVAQGGSNLDSDPNWPMLKAEFDAPITDKVIFTPLGSSDLWAPEVGHVDGFPVGRDTKDGRMWLIHCPGIFAFARDNAPDTASTEFYIVIGEAPRRLDRNLTAFGRVISGMQYLQKIKRGNPDIDNGVIPEGPGRDQIIRIRMASDLPPAGQPHFEVLKTDSAWFTADKQKRVHPGTSFLVREPPPVLDICNVPVPVRQTKD